MKSELLLTLFILFLIDVSGADVEVSVMVGDSVTLHTNIKVETDNVIKWRFKQTPIAEIDEGHDEITAPDVEFKGRLQLDKQTGELKIRNIKTKDSGDYKLEIITTKETSEKTFSVIVVPGDAVSLMVGDSVTFLTGLAEIQRGDLIMWMFGDTRIAEKHKGEEQFVEYDERFGDRLELVHQNGSLIITNTILADSGSYKLKINNSRYTIDRTITVTVTERVPVSVNEGDSVTLQIDAKIQNDDEILWMFGDTQLAKINIQTDQNLPISLGSGEKFRHRLRPDHQTGSLTITDTRTTDTGDYELKINSSRYTINRRISVTVSDSRLPRGAEAGIAIFVILVVAAVAGVIYYRIKISKPKKRTENGQNHKKQDTDDPNEKAKFANNPETENSSSL